MLDINGAKVGMLSEQMEAFFNTLSKTLEVPVNSLSVKVAAELEFYIVDGNMRPWYEELDIESVKIKRLIKSLMINDNKVNSSRDAGIESFEKEDGFNQFEVQFYPTNDPLKLAWSITNFKRTIQDLTDADFGAKPFKDQPTSSLHIHISVYYKNVNLFAKDHPRNDDEYHYLPLYWCIAGLLKLAPKFINIFAPTDNCKERYYLPKKGQKYIHYPTNLCWGFNNRTCAIRIPRKPSEDPLNCRIEHRISSSMADPYLVLFAIFAGMQYGVAKELECPEPIYGCAFECDDAGPKIIDICR